MMVKFHHILTMKSALSTLFILWFLWWGGAYSQHYVNLSVDNDLYFDRDFYYSSGIFLSYSSYKIEEKKTFINHFKLGQLIYTPSSRYETNPNKYDYPYSGYLFLEGLKQKQLSDYSSFTYGLNFGITGNASLAKGMQNLYHDIVLNLPNLEWKSQMPKQFQINLVANYFKCFKFEDKINDINLNKLKSWINRRVKGEPLQYITGKTEFYGLKFKTTPQALIPRPETERLVEIALNYIGENFDLKLLEIGTGSGCIPIAISNKKPSCLPE